MGFEAGLEQSEGLGLTEVLGEGVPELWGGHREGSVSEAPEIANGGGKQAGRGGSEGPGRMVGDEKVSEVRGGQMVEGFIDRALPRSTSAQSLSSLSSANSNSLPRDFSLTSGPAVNRALKPGRRKKVKKLPPVQPEDQHSHRRSPSPPAVITELVNHLPGLTVHDYSRRDRQRATKKAEFSARGKGLQSAEHVSTLHTNHRHSLDLDTHDLETRSQLSIERVPSKRLHHEWPQTKEDFNQHDFVPMEKPQQTYCEEDWYVGTCTRADAEHALHLVNKDGAFLVRDCSINSNSEPLVLAMYHGKKVYNVKIRFIESTSKYALGRGHRSNDMFVSVAEIIKFHSIFPVILISGRNMPGSKCPENCVLTCPVTRSDVEQLLQ